MKQTTIGGNKRKAANFLAVAGLIIIFGIYVPVYYGSDQFSETEERHY